MRDVELKAFLACEADAILDLTPQPVVPNERLAWDSESTNPGCDEPASYGG